MGHPKDDDNLTDKQRAFVIAYLGEANYNAKVAAEIAGYSSPYQAGWDNRRNPHVRRAIDQHLEDMNQVGLGQRHMRVMRLVESWERLDKYEKAQDKRISLRDIYSEKRQILAAIRSEVGDDIQRIEMNATVTNTDGAKDAMAKALNLVDSIESEITAPTHQA